MTYTTEQLEQMLADTKQPARHNPAAPELGDDLPYTTGQIWAACGVLAVVLLAVVFGGAWMGVQ